LGSGSDEKFLGSGWVSAEGAEEDAIERGGSIEVFPDAELAKGRAEYIRAPLRTAGWGLSTTTYADLY
jgi:hypothetical protein